MFRLLDVARWRGWRTAALVLVCTAIAFMQALIADRQGGVATAADAEGVSLPIIMYHGVSETSAAWGDYVISPAQFEADLLYLQEQGYTTVTMADLIAYVDEGAALPERPVMLTFDDGYYNNYLYAYPLLKRYGMRAVISPIGRWSDFYSDNEREQNHVAYSHITWEQMREMVADGTVEIQCHSYDMHHNDKTHRKGVTRRDGETPEQYRAVLTEDVTRAVQSMKEELGVTPTAFTYPFGAISRMTDEVLRELGFRATLGCESRMNRITRDATCLYRLGRYLRTHKVGVQELLK